MQQIKIKFVAFQLKIHILLAISLKIKYFAITCYLKNNLILNVLCLIIKEQ